jgi:hypothetical protein
MGEYLERPRLEILAACRRSRCFSIGKKPHIRSRERDWDARLAFFMTSFLTPFVPGESVREAFFPMVIDWTELLGFGLKANLGDEDSFIDFAGGDESDMNIVQYRVQTIIERQLGA